MSRAWSVSVGRSYGRARVCGMWGVSRSTHYARRQAHAGRIQVVAGAGRPR